MTRWSHERSHMLRPRVLPGLDRDLGSPPSLSLSLFLSILRSPHRVSSAGPVVRKTPETRVIPCVRACIHDPGCVLWSRSRRCLSRPGSAWPGRHASLVAENRVSPGSSSSSSFSSSPGTRPRPNPPRFSRPSVSSNAPSRSRPDDFIPKSCLRETRRAYCLVNYPAIFNLYSDSRDR